MMKKAAILWFALAAGVGAFALLARAGSTPAQAVEPEGASPGLATVVPGPATFVAVDEVTVTTAGLRVRGVLLDGSDVVDRTYDMPYIASGATTDSAAMQAFTQRCERLALLMLTKPGAYRLTMQNSTGFEPVLLACTLHRNE